jgi:hypothetical protein
MTIVGVEASRAIPDSIFKQPLLKFTHVQLLSRRARVGLFVSPHNDEGHGAPRGANVLFRCRHPFARRMVIRKRIALRRSADKFTQSAQA